MGNYNSTIQQGSGRGRWGMAIGKRAFDLTTEAFRASGLQGGKEVSSYRDKLDHLFKQFAAKVPPSSNPLTNARFLFNWLWMTKPARYRPSGHFKLNDVIDAQMSQDRRDIGNCLGLTVFYNCLFQKMGIQAEVLYLEMAFGRGPHVLTLLRTEQSQIDIENILSDGFDYRGHLNIPRRVRWSDKELVADIYLSQGNESFEKCKYSDALKNYDMAIHLNPRYEKAHVNKAILIDEMGMEGRG